MFLRCKKRRKDGKEHRYWSVVENRRVAGGKTVQKHVLYLGEINDSQQEAWRKSIEVFCEDHEQTRQLFLFPSDRQSPVEGLPLAYEVMPGDTADKTTLKGFLKKIEEQYGKSKRTWVMDRGIPTEEVLEQMRTSDPPVQYLVGTPRGRLNKLEASFLGKSWKEVREGIEVKLLERDDELYVLTQSNARKGKERGMRLKRLRRLIKRLRAIQTLKTPLKRDSLLLKLGEAKKEATRKVWCLLEIEIPSAKEGLDARNFTFKLNLGNYRRSIRHDGRYLLRSNLTDQSPETLWRYYMQLSQVEEAFKNIKGDLSIRPVYHQKENRIEAHIFISFLAYCLHVTLRLQLQQAAPGLTPRSVLEKMASIQMLDVHLPTTDGRELRMSRYTQALPEHQMILEKLNLKLPKQPKPRIYAKT
ncbi:MAG: IS1634 family transposase [Puniceicoccaceae bacterium]|nr:MAG: IS1634 family transposase [Puniceicoccaceae bacterium]